VADGRDRDLSHEVDNADRPARCVHDATGVYLVAKKCVQDAWGVSKTVRGCTLESWLMVATGI
jgi:hypothetical protein